MATRNFKGTNECHGWIGLRFQHQPGAEPSDIIVHVCLHDITAGQQQQSLGTLGVNLIHAAYYRRESQAAMFRSFADCLTTNNLEVDVVEITGPAFPQTMRAAEVAVDLLREGLTCAVVFDESGRMQQPSTVFRQRGLLVHRCSLSEQSPELDQMIKAGSAMLIAENEVVRRGPLPLLELSIKDTLGEGLLEDSSAVGRLEALLKVGHAVVVSNFSEMFRITTYLSRYSNEAVRYLLGLDEVVAILRNHFYAGINGGMLEGLGRLLAPSTRLYVFSIPSEVFRNRLQASGVEKSFCDMPDDLILSVTDIQLASPAGHLLNFLRDAGWVQAVDGLAVGEAIRLAK